MFGASMLRERMNGRATDRIRGLGNDDEIILEDAVLKRWDSASSASPKKATDTPGGGPAAGRVLEVRAFDPKRRRH